MSLILASQREKHDKAFGAICVCVSAVFCAFIDLCGQPLLYVYPQSVRVFRCLLQIYAQSCCCLGLGTPAAAASPLLSESVYSKFCFLTKKPKPTKPKGFTKYVNSSVRTDFFKRLSTVEVYLRRAN